MTARLRADIWVDAYMRRVRIEGGFAYLSRRGEASAGSILVRVEDGARQATVYSPGYAPGEVAEQAVSRGLRTWLRSTGPEPVPATQADDYIRRRLATDPDLWVVEVEDRMGRHFLGEPVEGEDFG